MVSRVLIDSSFLIALNCPQDKNHDCVRQLVEDDSRLRLIPDVALTEVAYMLRAQFGVSRVVSFLEALNAELARLEPVTLADVNRARQIMLMYADARLDLVDCCIVALAERLNIEHIRTLDRRDFSMIRPALVGFLQLLP